jgi:hypothetical protein
LSTAIIGLVLHIPLFACCKVTEGMLIWIADDTTDTTPAIIASVSVICKSNLQGAGAIAMHIDPQAPYSQLD